MSKGFITFALNTSNTDYLNLAYLQALNIKATQSINSVAVIVDKHTTTQLTSNHQTVFDYIIELPIDFNNDVSRFANEYQVFNLTPFDETFKLESDLIFTRSIDHWWSAVNIKDIVLSNGCLNYEQVPSENRYYRRFFDDNILPDIYNGLMYFKKTNKAKKFFDIAEQIQNNWQTISEKVLKNSREKYPSTDVLYAVAAEIFGRENCTMPSMDFIKFVHMKPHINKWEDINWVDTVITEFDDEMIRINNLNQYSPFHYFEKNFVTDELLNQYERNRK